MYRLLTAGTILGLIACADPGPLGPLGSETQEQRQLFESLGKGVISPAYAKLHAESEGFVVAVEETCSTDSEQPELTQLHGPWRSLMSAWQAIEIVRFGPSEEQNNRLRIQFFPDANNAVEKGVDGLLVLGSDVTEVRVAEGNVGAQGIPALVFLLFEANEDRDSTTLCPTLKSISSNLASITNHLADAWSDDGQTFKDFTGARGTFVDQASVLTLVVESLATELEYITSKKIQRPLNVGVQGLESWGSEHSVENLVTNVRTLQLFLTGGDLETDYGWLDYLRRVHQADQLSDDIEQRTAQILETLDSIEVSASNLLDTQNPEVLQLLYTELQRLSDLVKESAQIADLSLGFNSMDGD
ncbi:MAG: imelysin family protein [Pseudomonadota bacterium]